MKALIVEDSRLARVELKEQLKAHSFIELVGEAENVPQALELIAQHQPELLFLDIHMPKQTGFDLIEQLNYQPQIIFTTAYSEFAAQSFDVDATDYLLKPITAKRLQQAINKLNINTSEQRTSALTLESAFFVKDRDQSWFIKLNQVTLFESIGNYTRVYFNNQKPMIYKALSAIEKRLPEAHFFRASRNFIINVNAINNIEHNVGNSIEITLNNAMRVEVSRRQTAAFKKRWSL